MVFPVFDSIRWRPRVVDINGMRIKIHHTVPYELQFSIESNYTSLFQAFLLRGRAAGGYVVTACDLSDTIFGLGIVGPDEEFGTFFCPENLLEKMMKYAGVKYAYSETCPKNLKKIEVYDVFRVEGFAERDLDFDTSMLKPLGGSYLEPVMQMIAHEDYGKSNAKLSHWVSDAIKTDVAFVATAPLNHEWIRKIITGIREPKLLPSIINNEVIIGAGFTTPSENDAWLYGLYVHPAFRNTGVGRTLVMARLTALKGMGINTAITEIADWNSSARKIYSRFAACPIGKYYYIGTKMPKVKVRRH